MVAEPAGADMSAARRETKKSGAPDRRRYIQVARETTSVGGALQETSDPFGNSEEVARLYTELVNSFGSNDSEAVRLIYRALLRLGRPRAEILAEVARVAAAQEATQTRSGSLGQAIAPTELESVAPTTAVHAQSRPRLLPASAGFRPALNSANLREARSLQRKERKESRPTRLNVRSLLRAPAACFTPLGAAAGTAILINLLISAGATSSVPKQEATAPSTEASATPFEPTAIPSIETPASAPAEPARILDYNDVVRHLSAGEVATLRARGDTLLSMGDVTSSRLFYERAFIAGDAQAAIRLGATYDPVFLSRARVQGMRGDMAIALEWYRRARDLGAVEAESLLRSIQGN
jgi:hypothetical protein